MAKNGKVVMAMSGGVDSSMSALMLYEQGYEVIGITLKVWDYNELDNPLKKEHSFIQDARQLAQKIGFSHYVIDAQEEFNKIIVQDFSSEYLSGRTPNPCALCNPTINWKLLLQKADELGFEFISTGQYTKINKENNRYFISKGKDETKDQSYMLWRLSQDQLKRTIFPLGNLTKKEIKERAEKEGYQLIAQKKESYEICFIPDNDYRSFLKKRNPEITDKYDGGNFVMTNGKIIGKHKGYPFYTIGQRKGLNVAVGVPLYVTQIIPETNTVVLGYIEELGKSSFEVMNYNLMKYTEISENMEVTTKIRYKDKGCKSTILVQNEKIIVNFTKDVNAIAPGQSAVFYENEDVVGGGIII